MIYLDIWATWCGPCIKEIPDYIQLQKEFQFEKITFISVFNGKNAERWQEIIDQYQVGGMHYYLGQEKSDVFRSKLNFFGYPTYMLLKDGKVVDPSTYPPSQHEKAIRQIQAYLK